MSTANAMGVVEFACSLICAQLALERHAESAPASRITAELLPSENVILDLLPVAVYVCEAPSGVIRRYNRRAVELWGRAPAVSDTDERFCGAYRLYLPDGRPLPHAETPMAKVLGGGAPVHGGVVIIERPDGSRVWVEVDINPLHDKSGRVIGAVNVFQDISERRRAEDRAKLQRLTARLSAASTPEGIAEAIADAGAEAADARAAFIFLPDHAGALRALPSGGAEARDGAAHGLTAPEPAGLVAEIARAGQARFLEMPSEIAAYFPRMDALAEGVGAMALIPLAFEDGSPGALAFAYAAPRVFSPEAREFLEMLGGFTTQALERAHLLKTAQEAVQFRDDFLSMASHELKTPLTALRLQVTSLGRRLNGEAAPSWTSEKVRSIDQQTARLTRLVDQLLDVSRVRAGRFSVEIGCGVDLARVVAQVVRRLTPQIEAAGSPVQVRCEESLIGRWDELRLDQVVTNLVTNALKYGAGTQVDIEAWRDGEHAYLRVRDQGIGIEPEAQRRIFERFERAASARGRIGIGLGLWITRALVEAHGGEIRLESAPGQGATFTVCLPLDAAPRA